MFESWPALKEHQMKRVFPLSGDLEGGKMENSHRFQVQYAMIQRLLNVGVVCLSLNIMF